MQKLRYLFLILFIFIFSCKKDSAIINNNNGDFVRFSVDTLLFDTLFTTIGSTTRYLKVYNNYNQDIYIDRISLGRQEESPFKLNIDGEANHTIDNTLLRSGDSLYIFAEVTIDPLGSNTSLIETDSIIFIYNNMVQDVNLAAWGRDAYFHSGFPDFQQNSTSNLDSMLYSDFFSFIPDELINESFYYYSVKENTYWNNEKPHVIYGDVIIENNATLTIQEGTEVYLHNKSWLIINESSSLHCLGTKSSKIKFQSDRNDSHSIIDYNVTPGQWGKIWILPGSINNQFEHTILKNGTTGIQVDGVNDINNLPFTPMLTIKNSKILNMSNIGLLAQGSKVIAENILIANCGLNLLSLNIGGDYSFKHCTFANYWPFTTRQTPSIFINNYYEDVSGVIQNRNLIRADFKNSIIMGNNQNEIYFDKSEDAIFNYSIDHCILKIDSSYWNEWKNQNSENNIICDDVNFLDFDNLNFLDTIDISFELDEKSVAIDAGSHETAAEVPTDYMEINRTKNPDIGYLELSF